MKATNNMNAKTDYTMDRDGFRVRADGFCALDESGQLVGLYDEAGEAWSSGQAMKYFAVHPEDLGRYRNTTVVHTYIDPDGYADVV